VVVTGWDSSWSYGRFEPAEAFSQFAPFFGAWSLLMHDDEHKPLHRSVADALAEAERSLDSLHVEVHFDESNLRQAVAQLNIDGELVEWKQV